MAARIAAARRDERGFTLAELLVASLISMLVLAAAIGVAGQVARSYTSQLDAAAIEEEARFAVEWIVHDLRAAGSNPYGITISSCPTAGTSFLAARLDPNGNGADDDVRINADAGLPNGLLGGDAGSCTEAGEDVTIAYDPVARVITRRDNNVEAAPVAMSDTVISNLQFTYLDPSRAVTADPAAVAFVQVSVTAQARTMNPRTGGFDTFTAQSEVHLRAR